MASEYHPMGATAAPTFPEVDPLSQGLNLPKERPPMTMTRIDSNGCTSQAVIDGNTIYLAGQVATHAKGQPIGPQTKEILTTIDSLLARCGSNKSKLLRAVVYLANRADFEGMNTVWGTWIDAEHPPVRSTVQATLLDKDWLLEIVITASR